MIRRIAIASACVALTACALPPTAQELASADYGDYPSDYESVIRSRLAQELKDPYSAEVRFLNAPKRGWDGVGGSRYGYVVCAMINAKNSFGGYTGYRPSYFMIRDGRVIHSAHGDGNYMDALVQGKCKHFV